MYKRQAEYKDYIALAARKDYVSDVTYSRISNGYLYAYCTYDADEYNDVPEKFGASYDYQYITMDFDSGANTVLEGGSCYLNLLYKKDSRGVSYGDSYEIYKYEVVAS